MYKSHCKELVSFARKLFEHTAKKLAPFKNTELVYRRLIEACGTCKLKDEIEQLFTELKEVYKVDPDKVTFGTHYHAFALASLNTDIPGVAAKDMYVPTMEQMDPSLKSKMHMSPEQEHEESKGQTSGKARKKLSQILESHLYLNITKQCLKCEAELREEELLSLFPRDAHKPEVRCPVCGSSFSPEFKVHSEFPGLFGLNGREGKTYKFLSPIMLYKELATLAK